MTEHITVGYDGSPKSRTALEWAAEEAALRGATVKAVACYTTPVVAADMWIPPAAYRAGDVGAVVADHLTRAVEAVRRHYPGVAFDCRVLPGTARTELVVEAADSALLVVGHSRVGAVSAVVLGSVASHVTRTSPCPVVVVPSDMLPQVHRRVVVGVDGSPASDRALDWASDEADRRDAELVVVHAWHYPYGGKLASQEVRDLTRVDAGLVLRDVVERSEGRGLGPVKSELIEGAPARALLDLATTADLLVVGLRGRGAVHSLLFGSVAHAVTEQAICPVVVVRP